MVARVATARRLAAIVYHVLRERRAYQPRPPKRSLPEGCPSSEPHRWKSAGIQDDYGA